MRVGARRRLDAGLLVVGAAAVGAASAIGAAVGDQERVARMWVAATVQDDGSAAISEVIDYDFGASRRHGIFRDVPGLSPTADVVVSSPSAPDDVELIGSISETRIRIGDPDRTVTGRHRYRVEYPLPRVVEGRQLAWNAVGTAWEVPIGEVEVHVVAPFELDDLRCVQGAFGSRDPCQVEHREPGHVRVRLEDLSAGRGATLYATVGERLERPESPAAPSGDADDPGAGLALPAALGAGAALLASAATSPLVRRAGRERVAVGGATEAAFATSGAPEVRLDHERLGELATIEFAPPPELSPAQGGVLLAEAVRPQHKVAWLVHQAVAGTVDLDEDRGQVTLIRRDAGHGPDRVVLDTAFGGRDRVRLGRYDAPFSRAWAALDNELRGWQRQSELWDPAGDRRRTIVRIVGVVAAVLGLGIAVVAAAFANRSGGPVLAGVVAGGLAAGAGWAAALRAWELRVRTPKGSALWLRVESFRRFLAASEAEHASEAAARGVLREYTAWAVAVGEIDRWSRAVASAGVPDDVGVRYALIAPRLTSMTTSTSVKPSSGGGGGGGGVSVGGGAGGGGGGSW